MVLPPMTGLTFEEKTHTYRVNGIVVPSVTEIMKPLASAHYGGIDAHTLANAAKRGTAVHHAIENFIKFGVEDIPAEYANYLMAFRSWWRDCGITLIVSEGRVYHRFLRYAGTVDLPCLFAGKKLCVDFKTSAAIAEMLVRVQLEGYARAYDSHDVTFDEKAIVHLKRDGTYTMVCYPAKDTEAYEVFGSLLTVHNYIQKYRRNTA
jgi:hypothetical protein